MIAEAARVGERVPYRDAGAASRQAHRRALALPDLTLSDAKALAGVLDATTSYSKLTEEIALDELARRSGVSVRHLRRRLPKLAEAGVIVHRPGRGAGKLTLIGVPPQGMKGDAYASALGLPDPPSFAERESGQEAPVKGDTHARARKAREEEEQTVAEEERLRSEAIVSSRKLEAKVGDEAPGSSFDHELDQRHAVDVEGDDAAHGAVESELEKTERVLALLDEVRQEHLVDVEPRKRKPAWE